MQVLDEQAAGVVLEFLHRVGHVGYLDTVMVIQLPQQTAALRIARVVVAQPAPHPLQPGAEDLPGGVARMRGDLPEQDQPNGPPAPAQVEHPRPGGGGQGARGQLGEQPLRRASRHRVEAEVVLREQTVGLRGRFDNRGCRCGPRCGPRRGRVRGVRPLDGDQLAVGHVVADQFIQRPGVEWLVLRLVGQDVVCREPLQPVRQTGKRRRTGIRDRTRPAFDDEDVQPLTLQRQLLLDIHPPGTAGEEVGERDAEESVPGGEGVHGGKCSSGAGSIRTRSRAGQCTAGAAGRCAGARRFRRLRRG